MAFRLNKFIGRLVSMSQTTFIPGRQILDRVLVVNELIDLLKRKSKRCILFKVDFKQAYDCVEWKFFDNVMSAMNFGDKLVQWIRGGVCISFLLVLVNGSTTEDLKCSRGLRQGDPLSPSLFTLVAKGLTLLVMRVI